MKVEISIENERTYMRLILTKQERGTKTKLKDVQFTLTKGNDYVIKNKTTGEISYKNINEWDKWSEKDKWSNIFTTNNLGQITIEKIKIGTYTAKEIYNPNPYFETYPDNQTYTIEVKRGNDNTINDYTQVLENETAYMDLLVIKKDEDTKKPLKDVQFEITNANDEYVIQSKKDSEKISYKKTSEWESWSEKNNWNKVFTTDKNGKISISKVKMGMYKAKEISNPNEGYEMKPNTVTKIEVKKDYDNKPTNNTYEKIITNKRKYVDVSGFVWKDQLDSKTSTRNNSYDASEKGFNGIKVSIKDKNGNSLTNRDGNTIGSETTSERGIYDIQGGEYRFKQVKISDLNAGTYIEFEYDGLIWQSVVKNLSKNNGSKAIDDKARNELDKKFDSISFGSKASDGKQTVKFNKGQSTIGYSKTTNNVSSITDSSSCTVIAKTNEAGYKFEYSETDYKAGVTEIKYINLGVYEKPQADLALAQDLENVQVVINGYNQIYTGKDRIGTDNIFKTGNPNGYDAWNVAVKFKDAYTGEYSRIIYEPDAKWESQDKSKELQLYLTYRIGIKNESTYLTKINSIVDYYDSKMEVVKVGTNLSASGDNTVTGEIKYNTENDVNGYKKITITTDRNIEAGNGRVFYIQFKVNRATVLKMLNNEETNIVNNVAEINSYTVYKDTKGNTVAAVDKDSVPGNITPGKSDTYEDDTDAAPPVKLQKGQRKLSGIAFVDKAIFSGNQKADDVNTGSERMGNGRYDDKETLLKGVEVSLVNTKTNETVATYTTNEKGAYTFEGFIPGQYKVTFKWGNKEYTVQDYKSTKYNLGEVDSNNNLIVNRTTELYWYRDENTRNSDAIDNYDKRKTIDSQLVTINNDTAAEIEKAYNGQNKNYETIMESTTPIMEFSVEKNRYDTILVNAIPTFEVKNIDFGIIERAKQAISMDKRVKTFKITLSNGQVIADVTIDEKGNKSGTTNHVNYLTPNPKSKRATGKVKAEMDNELIEGATLEIGYEIKFTNQSEIDYMTEDYYKYGTVPKDKNKYVVKLRPSTVYDYLDNRLSISSDENNWTQISKTELTTNTDKTYISSRKILQTDQAGQITPKIDNNTNNTTTINLKVSKLLSASDEITFDNKAEDVAVSKVSSNGEKINTHLGRRVENLPQADSEQVVVTPSTGENRDYMTITIIGITALIVLAGGIIIIKKKIL